jgi:hypothetical protein
MKPVSESSRSINLKTPNGLEPLRHLLCCDDSQRRLAAHQYLLLGYWNLHSRLLDWSRRKVSTFRTNTSRKPILSTLVQSSADYLLRNKRYSNTVLIVSWFMGMPELEQVPKLTKLTYTIIHRSCGSCRRWPAPSCFLLGTLLL